jgi:MazG family protein
VADTDGLGRALVDLQTLTERLRRECHWDRAQTPRTIVPHTVEEAYEVADAAMAGDDEKLLDELGDLLFQTYFLSLLLQEKGLGDLAAVARRVHEKLVRRHPHVFESPAKLDSPGQVKERWENLKTRHEGREGIFHHVPEALPALSLAKKVQRRAATIGFEYPHVRAALADLEDELEEFRRELPEADPPAEVEPEPRLAAELGDVLFACVNVARRVNADPELELRRATGRFVERVEEAVRLAREEGLAFVGLPVEEQDRFFDRAKEAERR